MTLKNRLWFYLLIFLPIVVLVSMAWRDQISASVFTLLMMTYVFAYHPSISGMRLLAIGVIQKKDFLRNYIPMWNMQYFGALFF